MHMGILSTGQVGRALKILEEGVIWIYEGLVYEILVTAFIVAFKRIVPNWNCIGTSVPQCQKRNVKLVSFVHWEISK